MRYSLTYQYIGPGDARPEDYQQQDDLTINPGEPFVIPNVGDGVTLMLTKADTVGAYKVVSRLFSYAGDWCGINIVVTDMTEDEMGRFAKA